MAAITTEIHGTFATCAGCRKPGKILAHGFCCACYHRNRRARRRGVEPVFAVATAIRQEGVGPVLTIDFSKCPEVLESIERTADSEERTAEQQARYVLRKMFEGGLGAPVAFEGTTTGG
jgi:hypothetical protein